MERSRFLRTRQVITTPPPVFKRFLPTLSAPSTRRMEHLPSLSNTVGNNNTASGAGALSFSTTGADNTAIGYQALDNNTTGFDNTAIGYQALYSNATTVGNTAIGIDALLNNTAGGDNIALGDSAGSFLTTGSNNIDIGNNGVAGEANTIRIGDEAVQTATLYRRY